MKEERGGAQLAGKRECIVKEEQAPPPKPQESLQGKRGKRLSLGCGAEDGKNREDSSRKIRAIGEGFV